MKLPLSKALLVPLLTLLSFASFADETKFAIGPALGKDTDAFAKAFGVELNKPTHTEGSPQKPTGYIWFADVPQLGNLMVRRVTKDDFAVFIAVRFSDQQVTTWQIAFQKLGLQTEGKVGKKSEEEDSVSITFPTENGKSCEAFFYKTDPYAAPAAKTKAPTITFTIE